MATLADSGGRETPRVLAIIAMTLAAMAGTTAALDFLGLNRVWEIVYRLPFWQGLALCAALWGGVIVLCLRLPRIIRAVATLLRTLVPVVVAALARSFLAAPGIVVRTVSAAVAPVIAMLRITGRAAAAAFAPLAVPLRVAGRIAEPYRLGFWMIAQPVLEPALHALRGALSPLLVLARWLILAALPALWQRGLSPLIGRAAALAQTLLFEWKLWRTYRAEFRGAYASYREFKSALNARMYSDAQNAQQDAPPPPARDPFAAACETMGLRADGQFTEAEFKARYRALMKKVHPDIAGPNARAAEVNAAHMLIKKRKGW
jgi:hypothetical protein